MSIQNTAVPSYFLRTKLYRPPLPDDHIQRPRLLAQLEKISRYQIAGIIAPAGYGKSTLASAWLDQARCPSAWVSLDKGDDDLVVFMGYFITAVRSIFPEFGEQILKLAQSASRPSLSTISNYLLDELDRLEQKFVLVLDDIHTLTNPDIHELLGKLLHYSLPHFQLILISRFNLPSQLSKLRAQSRLIELRAKDLRFSTTEVADFIEKLLPTLSDTETIKILAEKTEGWPVGLRLATIAIRRWGVDDHLPAVLQVENAYILEYLVNEVLARQPAAVRDFLLKSSILDRFCAPLCAAMMDTESLDLNILQQLEREGLFIESLDNQNEWFRYHHLFMDMLRHLLQERFQASDVAVLHLQASNWLAANGFLEDAIDHALASGDRQAAAMILTKQSRLLINDERWLLLESLLNKFPSAFINEDPNLLLVLAWLNLTRGQLGKAESIRGKLAAYLETEPPESEERRFMECSHHMIAAITNNWSAKWEQAIFHARQALALTRPEWGLVYAYVWIHLGTGTHQLKGGQAGLADLTDKDYLAMSVANKVRKQIALCFVDWFMGDMGKLLHTAQNGLALIDGAQLLTSKSMLHFLAGSACYARNELDLARQHFSTVRDLKYGYQFQAYVFSVIGQALIYQAQNRVDEARQMSKTAVNFCLEMEQPSLLFIARAFQAELALRQGRLDRASLWASQTDGTTLTKLMPFFYQPQMTLPKIWLTEGSAASLKKAEIELLRLHDIVTTVHNIPCQIKVLALQALLTHSQNKAHASEEALIQAIRLAQPGGYIRAFVDLGPKMAVLLKHLYMQGYAAIFIEQILDAFPTSRTVPNSTPPLALIESLTDREMEILTLLAQRLSNKEISAILVISPETVKRHTSNIYQKLQVKNRRQAVTKAFTLGLLVEMT